LFNSYILADNAVRYAAIHFICMAHTW